MKRDVVSKRVALLLALGLLQMAASVVDLPVVKAIAAATGASPAPQVFSRYGGLEPFSMTFALQYTTHDGQQRSVPITPERYRQLRGPYNRRNVYGAAIAAGPALNASPQTQPMLHSVLRHGLCGDAPLLRELNVDARDRDTSVAFALLYTARSDANTNALPLRVEVACQ